MSVLYYILYFHPLGILFSLQLHFFPFVLLWLYCSGVLQYGFVVAKRKRRKTKQDKEQKNADSKKEAVKKWKQRRAA